MCAALVACSSSAPSDAGGGSDGAADSGALDSGAGGDGGAALVLTSSAFAAGGKIPTTPYACANKTYGSGTSPPLAWTGAPAATQSFAIVMDDPSANDWTHWVLFDVSSSTASIAQGQTPSGAKLGAEQQGAQKYAGPCPPSGTHTYSIRLYALDVATLSLAAGATKAAVMAAMSGHSLASAELKGTVAAADL